MVVPIIDLNKDYNEQYPDFFNSLGYRESFTWECKNCHSVHEETEYRNFQRRKTKCPCQYNNARCKEIDEKLRSVGYTFLYNEDGAYDIDINTGFINIKKPIKVQCLRCDKTSKEFYYNILKGHKKCNCDLDKKFTRNLTPQEFVEKWPALNQKNFSLVEGQEYNGRNAQYKIICNNCGHEDTRWGITLIDSEILCKYCDNGSKSEQFISMVLDNLKIKYIREYLVQYNNHQHRFDFYLPEYNTCIEYNGQQHYQPIDYFGGQSQFLLRQERDKEKQQYCFENNIKLIIFRYDQSFQEIENQIGVIFND